MTIFLWSCYVWDTGIRAESCTLTRVFQKRFRTLLVLKSIYCCSFHLILFDSVVPITFSTAENVKLLVMWSADSCRFIFMSKYSPYRRHAVIPCISILHPYDRPDFTFIQNNRHNYSFVCFNPHIFRCQEHKPLEINSTKHFPTSVSSLFFC
jgi:hypothetical protein